MFTQQKPEPVDVLLWCMSGMAINRIARSRPKSMTQSISPGFLQWP